MASGDPHQPPPGPPPARVVTAVVLPRSPVTVQPIHPALPATTTSALLIHFPTFVVSTTTIICPPPTIGHWASLAVRQRPSLLLARRVVLAAGEELEVYVML